MAIEPGQTAWYRVRFDGRTLPDPRCEAPLVLDLEGEGLVGTIFVNGVLVGRWISDDRTLETGEGYRGIRAPWVPEGVSPDHFYLPRSILVEDGSNLISVALESLAQPAGSGHGASRSVLRRLEIAHARDGFDKTRDGGRIRALRRTIEVAPSPAGEEGR